MPEIQRKENSRFIFPEKKTDWVYWEQQNPRGLKIFLLIFTLLLLSAVCLSGIYWLLPLLLLPAMLWGGLELWINSRHLLVRFGLFRIPLLKISQSEIRNATPIQYPVFRIGIGYSASNLQWGNGWRFFAGTQGIEFRTAAKGRIQISTVNPYEVLRLLNPEQ